jgi:hypothetical protein
MASDPPLRESRMLRGWAHGFRSSAKGKKYDRLGPWPPVLRCGEEVRRGGGRERQSSEILPRVTLLFLNVSKCQRKEQRSVPNSFLYISFCVIFCVIFFVFHHRDRTIIRRIIPFLSLFLCLAENLPLSFVILLSL